MKSVSVSELKASLSTYLKEVKTGQAFTITHRGRPVATLSSVVTEGMPVANC